MEEVMRQALLRSYDLRRQAGEDQVKRGKTDTGNRSQTTSGKHMDGIEDVIADDLVRLGVRSDSIFMKSKDSIPGWFRATKKWDVLAFDGEQLMTAIELKSISSSYGKNLNNRVEEAVGSAVDADFAMRNKLLNRITPPLFAYAMVIKKDAESSSRCKDPAPDHFRVDPVFNDSSYIDRFRILCERLRRDRIYGAVWFVVVDPDNEEVCEPVPELSYEAFLAEIGGRVKAFDPSSDARPVRSEDIRDGTA